MNKYMYIYHNRRLICVESNMGFAIPYWQNRKRLNDNLTWEFK
jgi:hypothetical protein